MKRSKDIAYHRVVQSDLLYSSEDEDIEFDLEEDMRKIRIQDSYNVSCIL